MKQHLEQQLQTHAKALRALARDLVGEQDADDLAQETALQALRAPPARPGPIAAWLAAVARHLASKHRRANVRRARREAAAARVEALPSPADEVATAETFRRLTTAVASLPEPYQSTLLRRYLQEQEPVAIATATATPLATVKSRLQRGLAMLRERLERDSGGGWRAGIAAACGLKDMQRVAPTSAMAGGLVMTMGTKWLLGGLAAALAVAAWTVTTVGRAVDPSLAGRGLVSPQVAAAASRETHTDDAVAAAGVERLEATAAVATFATVRGRCVDRHGSALAGCRVHLDCSGTAVVEATDATAADGTFELRIASEHREFEFEADGIDCVPARSEFFELLPGKTLDLGDIALWPGCRVQGRVVDAAGNVVPAATVSLQRMGPAVGLNRLAPAHRQHVTTAADGSFAFPPCLAGEHAIAVEDQLVLDPSSLVIRDEDRERRLEIKVEDLGRLPSVRGIVVDQRGVPVAEALIDGDEDTEPRFHAMTGSDGTFTLRRTTRARLTQVRVTAVKDGTQWQPGQLVDWGREDLRFVLQDLFSLEIEAVDAVSGAPVEDFAVRFAADGSGPAEHNAYSFKRHFVGHHSDGRLRIANLWQSSYVLRVEPDGVGLAASMVQHLVVGEPVTHVRVEVPRLAEGTLQLVSPSGQPVVACTVEVCDAAGTEVTPQSWAATEERWGSIHGIPYAFVLQRVTTDSQGNATLRGPAGKALALRMLGPGCQPQVAEVRLDPAAPLRLTVQLGGTLRVQFQPLAVLREIAALGDASLPKASGINLRMGRTVNGKYEQLPQLSEPPFLIASDGVWERTGIPPGNWRVGMEWPAGTMPKIDSLQRVDITEGGVTEAVIDLAPLRPITLRGHARLNGAACANQKLVFEVVYGDAADPLHDMYTVSTDGDGAFLLRARPGRYDVRLQVPSQDCELLATPSGVEVAPGATAEQDFDIATGTLVLRVVDDKGAPVGSVHAICVARANGYRITDMPDTDADGTTRISACETGTLRLEVLPKRLDNWPAITKLMQEHPGDPTIVDRARIQLGTVTVVQGKRAELEVRLPPEYFR
jgi:RNA polymerase sigma-70 factor (ECF subfamily)